MVEMKKKHYGKISDMMKTRENILKLLHAQLRTCLSSLAFWWKVLWKENFSNNFSELGVKTQQKRTFSINKKISLLLLWNQKFIIGPKLKNERRFSRLTCRDKKFVLLEACKSLELEFPIESRIFSPAFEFRFR